MHVLKVVTFAFTLRLRVEDDHRGGCGWLEGFAQREKLSGSRERLRERRQLFERDIGWQSRVHSQHGCHNAVGQQTFWLHTENDTKTQKNRGVELLSANITTPSKSQEEENAL